MTAEKIVIVGSDTCTATKRLAAWLGMTASIMSHAEFDRLLPDPPKPKVKTAEDEARIQAAAERRARRNAKRVKPASNGEGV